VVGVGFVVVLGVLVGLASTLGGCESIVEHKRNRQLEKVAKDWCMTIRASQVIPVYPLTQDVQPGDVFLVQLPVDRQQEQYRARGFLALDNHLARLDPNNVDGSFTNDYARFYERSFLSKAGEGSLRLPTAWMRPESSGTNAPGAWTMAPRAAFPTYSFSVKASGGLNLAVPVSSVPVGLSLLGAASANGSISIKNARTYGVDVMSLHARLTQWAEEPERRAFLANFGTSPRDHRQNYLRVITRVYLTGELDVQLNHADSLAGGLDAGAARPVDQFLASPPAGPDDVERSAGENYRAGVSGINAMLAERDVALRKSGQGVGPTAAAADADRKERERLHAERVRAAEASLKAEQDSQSNRDAIKKAEDAKKALDEARGDERKATRELLTAEAALEKAKNLPESDPTRAAVVSAAEADLVERREAQKQAIGRRESALASYERDVVPAATATAKIQSAQNVLDELQAFVPGASVRVAMASSRSVLMSEKFDPPLVLGYLAFDVAIREDGVLGVPIPTHAVLNHGLTGSTRAFVTAVQSLTGAGEFVPAKIRSDLRNLPSADEEARLVMARLDSLGMLVPKVWLQYDERGTDKLRERRREWPATAHGYDKYVDYRGALETSISALERAKSSASWPVHVLFGEDSDFREITAGDRARLLRALIDAQERLGMLKSLTSPDYESAAIRLWMQRVQDGVIRVRADSIGE
jgi:hypothetical protein